VRETRQRPRLTLRPPRATVDRMEKPPKPLPARTERDAAAAREARLAAALRANLGRRKAQARGRAEPPPPEPRDGK
jgi:hypothetical protein